MVTNQIIDLVTQETVLKRIWQSLIKQHKIEENRHRRNVIFRHSFATAARANSDLSLIAVSKIIKKDHATVIHAMKQHETNYLYDDNYRTIYNSIAEQVTSKLAEFRFEVNRKPAELTVINADRALKIQNMHLKRQINDLKKDIEILKELHENQMKGLAKNYKQIVEDKKEVEDKLKDFRRRYML